MNIRDRTKELIGILSTKYKMQIFEESDKICCNGGRLMNFPLQIWILPKLEVTCFIVRVKSGKDGYILSADMIYTNDIPLERMLDITIERLIKTIIRKERSAETKRAVTR